QTGALTRLRYAPSRGRTLAPDTPPGQPSTVLGTPGRQVEARRLGEVECVALQVDELDDLEGGLVGCRQHHAWGGSGLERLLPARRAQAPAVAWLEAGKAEFRVRGGKIVANGLRESQELHRRLYAHSVDTGILRTGVAAAGAVEAGERLGRAEGDRLA